MKILSNICILVLFCLSLPVAAQKGSKRQQNRSGQQEVAFFDFTPDTIRYRNGSRYIGGIVNDQLHGKGVLLSPYDDTLYVGEFEFGKKEGLGRYYFKNGNKYRGEWQDNHMHGKGKMTFLSGDI